MHSGITLPGGHTKTSYQGAMVSPSCAIWLHVINMFTPRERLEAQHVVDTSWQWVLDQLEEPGAAARDALPRRGGGRSAGN